MHKSRRHFLGTASASLAALGAPRIVNASFQPIDIRVGVIGVGGYGMVDARAALRSGGTRIAAICDVDSDHLKKAGDEIESLQKGRPKEFKLYEEMLDQTKLEAVIIATPPHWHALQLIAAIKKNLHVYCEKPLSYDIREGQAMIDAARATNRVVQIGFQRRQSKAMKQAADFLRSGEAGAVGQVDVQIHYTAGTVDPTPKNPPASLDWDLWCGPGPLIPYSDQVGHKHWRLEKTSGHGHLVDWGIHNIDAARWILGLSTPDLVAAAGGIYKFQDIITTPDILTAHFEFDGTPLVWRHRLWGATEIDPDLSNGILFYCERATVFASDRRWILYRPKGKAVEREVFEIASPPDFGVAHMNDFLQAIRETRAPACQIEEGHRSTTAVHLAMIAYETESNVRWKDVAHEIVDNPAAQALLSRAYRAPHRHPHPDA